MCRRTQGRSSDGGYRGRAASSSDGPGGGTTCSSISSTSGIGSIFMGTPDRRSERRCRWYAAASSSDGPGGGDARPGLSRLGQGGATRARGLGAVQHTAGRFQLRFGHDHGAGAAPRTRAWQRSSPAARSFSTF
mmetsp:Transcript_41488/g.115583  ORF Transcript_41488/g.115583 Transcript_41488/m.115583 type:complete len:134 (+) Transcript_41488:144-545(+)